MLYLASLGSLSGSVPTPEYVYEIPAATEVTNDSWPSSPWSFEWPEAMELLQQDTAPRLRIDNGRIIDERTNNPFTPLGVGMHGLDYMCINSWDVGKGFFDVDADAAMVEMKRWGVNIVRLPINAQCLVGTDSHLVEGLNHQADNEAIKELGLDPEFTGQIYRQSLADTVSAFNKHGMAVIIDIHRSEDPDIGKALDQNNMLDEQTGLTAIEILAKLFGDNKSVVVEPYNEPHDIPEDIWLNGGEVDGEQYVGMQQLVDVFRAAGGNNIMIISPLEWAHDLPGAANIFPDDRLGNLAVSFHSYKGQPYSNELGWGEVLASTDLPVFLTEGGSQLNGEGDPDIDFTRRQVAYWLSQPSGRVAVIGTAFNPSFPNEGHRLVDEINGAFVATSHGEVYLSSFQNR